MSGAQHVHVVRPRGRRPCDGETRGEAVRRVQPLPPGPAPRRSAPSRSAGARPSRSGGGRQCGCGSGRCRRPRRGRARPVAWRHFAPARLTFPQAWVGGMSWRMATNDAGPAVAVPDDPTDLDRDAYLGALKRSLAEIKRDDVPGLAAGVAFKIFLALFPALFAGVAVFSIVTTPAEMQTWLESASGFLPPRAIEVMKQPLTDIVEGKKSVAGLAALIGVAAGLWAATGAAVSLMKALSRAYDVDETRKFVRQRLIALALTVALLAALLGIVALLILGPQIQTALLGDVPAPFKWVLAAARFVLALGVLVLLFAFVYWIGPNRSHPSWLWISPGAVLGVVGWLVASGGFTFYAQTASNYDRAYGTIAGVAIMLIWLQISMLVILVGAEFNAEVERARALYTRVGEGAGFAAPGGTAAMIPPHPEAPEATLVQTEKTAHTVEPPGDHPAVPSVPEPPPSLSAGRDAGSGPAAAAQSRALGTLAAAFMAAAVFLGFARRRSRR
ncbi:MAG: YihY family inner membrane protein [Nitriliruptorales bacterium]|nr:YihY family inner membrane protein [Nitriliruptorales bacterium]